jgi:hypothetical protein
LLSQNRADTDKADTDEEIRSISRKIFGRLFIKSRKEKERRMSRKKQATAVAQKIGKETEEK